MIENLFVANSAYSLLLYALRHTDKIDKTFFVLGPSLQLAEVPFRINMPAETDPAKQAAEAEQILATVADLKLDIKHAYINIQSVGEELANRLMDTYPVTALSDGLSDFQNFPRYIAAGRVSGYLRVGKTDEAIPFPTHPNMEVISLTDTWKRYWASTRLKIASIFGVKKDDLLNLHSRGVILVTQPLSEDGIMTEEEKRQFYTDIASNYPADQIVIKPHPREKTQWHKVFHKTPIISGRVPMELLALMVPVKRLATFYSTAGTNIVAPKKVDFYSKGFEQLTFVHPENPKMGTTPYVNIEERLKGCPFHWCRVPNKSKNWYRPVTRKRVRTSKGFERTHDSD